MAGAVLIALWWIGVAAIVGWVASRRGEDWAVWLGISLVASPLVASLLLIALPQNE
jgi:hypothetical protein